MIPFVTRTVNTLFGHRRLILERVMKQISSLNDRQRSQNKAILISLNTLYVVCQISYCVLVYNIDNLAIHWEPRDQGWVVFIDVWAR